MAATVPLPPMSHYAKATLTVAAVIVVLVGAWLVRDILILGLVAVVVALGLDPAVRALERLRLPRGAAIALVLLLLVGFIVSFSLVAVPPLVQEARTLATQLPHYIREASQIDWVADLEQRFDLSSRLRDAVKDLPHLASTSFGTLLGFTESLVFTVLKLLTILFLTLYLLAALPRIRARLPAMFAPDRRDERAATVVESLDKVSAYVAGKALIALVAGVLSFAFFKSIGLPYAVALAMFVAIADLIPVVGGGVAALVAALVAAFTSVGAAIAVVVFFVVYLLVENHLLVPRVLGKAVDLSPASVVLIALIGASLGGLAGALLSIPLAAAAKVIVTSLWAPSGPPARAVDASAST